LNTQEHPLQEELRFFEKNKQEWLLAHRDEFAVILGSKMIGFYSDYESGFKAGLAAAGLGNPFLLRQICAEEPVYLIF
jgi:hypothetical protein